MQVSNIEIEEGMHYTIPLTYRDETTNLPVNVTGYSAELEIRLTFGDPSILLTLSTGNGRIILGGVGGAIDINFLPADTDQSQLYTSWTRAAYDLVVTDTFGKKKKILKGFVTISRTTSI